MKVRRQWGILIGEVNGWRLIYVYSIWITHGHSVLFSKPYDNSRHFVLVLLWFMPSVVVIMGVSLYISRKHFIPPRSSNIVIRLQLWTWDVCLPFAECVWLMAHVLRCLSGIWRYCAQCVLASFRTLNWDGLLCGVFRQSHKLYVGALSSIIRSSSTWRYSRDEAVISFPRSIWMHICIVDRKLKIKRSLVREDQRSTVYYYN